MEFDKRKINNFFKSKKDKLRLDELLKKGDCFPLHIVLHLTTTCNHNCNYCSNYYKFNKEEPKASIKTDDILNYIDEFELLGIENLVISGGGEPFLHRGISKIIQKLNQSSINYSIYTNLDIELTQDILRQFSPHMMIAVNINTLDDDIYRTTRGRKAYLERVKKNIENLIKRDVSLSVIVIIREDIFGGLYETINDLIKLGVKKIIVSSAFDLPYIDRVYVGQASIEAMGTLRKNYPKSIVRVIEPVGYPAIHKNRVFCKSSYFDITIGADYFLYPCCMTAYNPIFQLLDLKNYNSFTEAWQSEERKHKFDNFIPNCKTCWFGPVNVTLLEKWKQK